MTVTPDRSKLADLLRQLASILAQATQTLVTINVVIAVQINPSQSELDSDERDALMRLKDDGCPNGE